MVLDDCLKFANEHPVCQLATVDGDQPRVRFMKLVTADRQGFWFATLSPKALSRQLRRNPSTEVCFFNQATSAADWRVMRVVGKAEFVDDEAMVNRVVKERTGAAAIIGRPIDQICEVFRIRTGEACFWSLRESLQEEKLERVRF